MQIPDTVQYILWGLLWVTVAGLAITTVIVVPDDTASPDPSLETRAPDSDADEAPASAEHVEVAATVTYEEGTFQVRNDGGQTWRNATLDINAPGPSLEGYQHAIGGIAADETVDIPSDELTGPDGDVFDSEAENPETAILTIEMDDGWSVWVGQW